MNGLFLQSINASPLLNLVLLVLVVFMFLLLPGIFYIITLQSTLRVVDPKNRKMNPGRVWLLLIPLYGLIWHFFVVNNIADSIKAEAESLNISLLEPKPAHRIGITMCVLNCLSIIPILNILTGIIGLICWIVFWVKISSYKNILVCEKLRQ